MVDFLLIGSINGVIYKEVIPHIKDNRIKIGYNHPSHFNNSDIKMCSCYWFTSIRSEDPPILDLKEYREEYYKRFDNYDAINIDRVRDIPDYDGKMGVPITFLERWNSEQFEIVGGLFNHSLMDEKGYRGSGGVDTLSVDGQWKYERILIKRK